METKQRIIESYKKLVKENKTADISVADICRDVGVSRKTFYNYFHDRFGIIEDIMFEEIEKPLLKALRADFCRLDLMRMIFESFLYDKEFYKIAIMEDCQNSLYESLAERLAQIAAENDRNAEKKQLSEKEREYVDYRFGAEFVFLIKKWMMNGMKESPEFMSRVYIYPKFE